MIVKISNYSSSLLFLVQDAKRSDEEESNEQGSSMSCTGIVSKSCTQRSRGCASRGRVVRGHASRGCGSRQHGRGGRRQHRDGSSCDESRLWTSVPSEVQERPFTNNVGPTIPISEDDNLFLKFFPHQLISHIVNETNKYAKQCLESTDGSNPKQWETNEDEIKAFIGFTIMMGLSRRSGLYDNWSTILLFHCFPIASRIARHRFIELKRYLHFTDNNNVIPRGKDGYDKLAKIRPVLTAVQQTCVHNYSPHKECSVDEAMIKFKGQSTLKPYMPKKPIKHGIKVWVRADSHTGYVSQFYVYSGKDNDAMSENLGVSVVVKLSRPLVGGNYHLYFDNFFTSVSLLEKLERDNIYACGTFRKENR